MTRPIRRLAGAIALAAMSLACPPGMAAAPGAPEGYHLEKVVTIPGSNTGWDYSALDPQRDRLFIAHRKDGLHVYDIKAGKLVKTLPDSAGANTAALAPEFDLGIAGTTDGRVIVFRLSTLRTIARYASATAGFDGATFDPVSKRFAMVGEADPATQRTPVLFFDGKTGQPAGTVVLDSGKVDAPRPDGKGNIFLPLRDKAMVAKIDVPAMRVAGMLALTGCVKPAALELDRANQRVLVGCRGNDALAPTLAVLDAVSGNQLATLPIGHGVDEVMYDPRDQAIVTANGDDASMTVIRQHPAGQYRVSATIGTRPRARTGVLDERTGKIYLVNAEYIEKYLDGKEPETLYIPNTFSVLTYSK
jgi:hypothetical protein